MMQIGRNQYLFTKEFYNNIECNETIDIMGYKLYLGEDCNITIDNGLILIGYAVDVSNPEKSQKEMLCDLIKKISNNNIGPACTSNWCGRWVVIAFVDDKIISWNDACGLKQIFFDTNNTAIASQARYIAAGNGYEKEKTALDYIEIAKKKDMEYSWPLDKTAYSEIKRLLPNHILNVTDKTIKRAALKVTSIDYSKAVKNCSQAICNAMKAAEKRYKLYVTLTAGWDSRIVLSACNDLPKNYDIITFKYDWMTENNEDIKVARELCEDLGLEHKVLLCKNLKDDFLKKYCEHSENAHIYWIQMSRAIKEYGDGFLVKGSCNEILRVTSGNLYNRQITPTILCNIFNIPITDFSIKTVKDWLVSAKDFCKENHLSVLDLFYWEHRMGSWLAECCNENDVSGEMFTPFNSRNYLENGLSVSVCKRVGIKRNLISDILNENWNTNRTKKWTCNNKAFTYKVKDFIKFRMPIFYGLIIGLKARKGRYDK